VTKWQIYYNLSMKNTSIGIGAVSAFLAVTLGAFGAHYVKDLVGQELTAVWNTANRYHIYHALAILFTGLASPSLGAVAAQRAISWFVIGTILFSGSLYALTLTGAKFLGPITPVGGLCFLIGWAVLAKAAFSKTN